MGSVEAKISLTLRIGNTSGSSSPSARYASSGLLTLRDVTAATALSRSAVYTLMAESRFPKPVRVGNLAAPASAADIRGHKCRSPVERVS